MKSGARAVGLAESYRTPPVGGRSRGESDPRQGGVSTVAAVVVRADGVVDGFAFDSWTVGGTDATDTAIAVYGALDRDDVQYLLVSGVAPAWFNVLDLGAIHSATGRPVLSVSFEESEGLEPALRREFRGDALSTRLSIYERQPTRERLVVNGEPVFVRAVGIGDDEAHDVVRSFTSEGGRPEPLRVSRLAARAADRWRAVS